MKHCSEFTVLAIALKTSHSIREHISAFKIGENIISVEMNAPSPIIFWQHFKKSPPTSVILGLLRPAAGRHLGPQLSKEKDSTGTHQGHRCPKFHECGCHIHRTPW